MGRNKKKFLLLPMFFAIYSFGFAQTFKNYSLSADFIYGEILKHNKHLENLVKGPLKGGEFSIEWQTMGEKAWHQYLNFPSVGISTAFLDFSHPDTLGYAVALYPYLKFPIVRQQHFNMAFKAGGGLSYVTKTFYNATAYHPDGSVYLNKSNAAIGSHVNVYLTANLNMEIPLTKGWSITSNWGWNHTSNGSIVQPNSGINMLDMYLGIKYFPNYERYIPPKPQPLPDLPHKIEIEMAFTGGIRQLYYKDDKTYPIGTFNIAAYRTMTNFYRMGWGADLFYDGVFNGKSAFKRTYLTTDELKYKLRIGASFRHELLVGRLTTGFHFGLYLYNPVKNLEPYEEAKNGTLNKPLIYKYNIEKEDGWFYTKAVLKYALDEHFLLSLGLKTHLQKAEFIDAGIGYKF